MVGDEVVVHGRFAGKLLVETVDPERKTATLRNIGINALITDVAWTTNVPLKHLPNLKAVTDAIKNGEL